MKDFKNKVLLSIIKERVLNRAHSQQQTRKEKENKVQIGGIIISISMTQLKLFVLSGICFECSMIFEKQRMFIQFK